MSYFKQKADLILLALSNKNISNEDVKFIGEYLNKPEQILFYAMSLYDQQHSLRVARKVRENVSRRSKINVDKLIAAALLHDIGKAQLIITLRERILQSIFLKALKPLGNYLAERGRKNKKSRLLQVLYNYKYHPKIGGELLKELKGDQNIIYWVEHHHDEPSLNEPIELTIIREADSLN